MFQTTTNQYIIWWASKLGLPRGPSSRDDFHGFSLLNGYTWRYTPLTNPCNRSSPSDAAGPSGRSAWMGTTREDGALLVAKTTKILLGCHHFRQESPLEVDPPVKNILFNRPTINTREISPATKIHHRHKTLHRSPLPGATLYRILNNVIPSPAHIKQPQEKHS